MTKPFVAAALMFVTALWCCGATGPATQPAPAALPATAPAATRPVAPAIALRANVVVNGGMALPQANNFMDMQRRMVEQQRTYVGSLKPLVTAKLGQIVRLDLVDGELRAMPAIDMTFRGQRRVDVPGASGLWTVTCNDSRRNGVSNVSVAVNRYDFDKVNEGEYWQTILTVNDQYVMLQEQGVDGGAWLQMLPGTVRLNVNSMKNGRGRTVLGLHGPNLLQLYLEHPDEIRQYVVPMLVRMTGKNLLRPGAADVYGMFEEIPADPSAARAVASLLPRLDAELYPDRDAASKDLVKLGPAGVLAVLRLDRARLSEEQKGRIDAFLSTERRRVIDDPIVARQDKNFLLDALEDDDPAVRLVAKTCLETVCGHPLAFDPALDGPRLAGAVDAVRKSLAPPADPKAAPAPEPLPNLPRR